MTVIAKSFRYLLGTTVTLIFLGVLVAAAAWFYIQPQLPPIERLTEVQLQVPLRVFSSEGELIAEFGEQHRTPIAFDDLPPTVIEAILATEDDRFFEHPGVDYQGLLRAAMELIRTGEKRQGGSTITMQVARNFFLSSEKTYLRKLTEIFLALKIEKHLTKQQILELYLNKIYFGHRAYGIAAAAQVYYGVPIDELTLAQTAMIAGLPKAPSANNPLSNPERAMQRRNYVLGRMYALGFIQPEQYREALEEPDTASLHKAAVAFEAPYIAEMVRAYMVEHFGDDAYVAGYRVYTTLGRERQEAARTALRTGLLSYDRRHGYRGAVGHVELAPNAGAADFSAALGGREPVGGLQPALVLAVQDKSATAFISSGEQVELNWKGLSWAQAYRTVNTRGPEPASAGDILKRGDQIYVSRAQDETWELAQVPEVAGALVSLRPHDGAIQALSGGFDFYLSKFNRAVQAQRQPGSSFKPFVYSAALAKGYTVASLFNDAPVVFNDSSLETTWRPENYSGKFYGPTRMREALTHSRNLVSIRLLQAIGPAYGAEYVQRFGFEPKQIPRDLSLALGSGVATPLEMARAYSVWANGGFYVEPYFITEIRDAEDNVVFKTDPAVACPECDDEASALLQESTASAADADSASDSASSADTASTDAPRRARRVVDAANVYLMTSMMQDVVKRGTGRKAMQLGRRDLAGKTGTTNDQRDAWFCGFNAELVTTVWVGFDRVHPLGNGETGGRAALPIWVDYMGKALDGVPESSLAQPPGLVTVRIDPRTGMRLPSGESGGIFEVFLPDHIPQQFSEPAYQHSEAADVAEPLF